MIEYETPLTVLFQSVLFGIFLSCVYILWAALALPLGIRSAKKDNTDVKANKKRAVLKNVLQFFSDILYFVIITPISAIFLFGINLGMVRWYIVFAVFVGFYIYRITLGRIEKRILEGIFTTIHSNAVRTLKFAIRNTFGKIKIRSKSKNNRKERTVIFAINSKTGLK